MREKEIYLLALTAIKVIGPVTIKKIIEFFGDPVKPFKADQAELLRVEGVTEKVANEILRMNPEKIAGKMLREMDKDGIQLLTLYSDSYPSLLKEIYDPPPVLYFKGELKDDVCLGVVGTRRPTTYGKVAAEEIGRSLAANGMTVVSGLARGIDTLAHKAALDGGGRTIAVLGSGFKRFYPKENRKLAEKISEHGAIMTEFPPDTPPLPENFPRRNRVISGLSEAVVIVEAAEKSGALITANYALNQGRDVLAVPGNITSEKSAGTNNLIKEGAIPVISFDNIVDELPERIQSRIRRKSEGAKTESHKHKKESLFDHEPSLDEKPFPDEESALDRDEQKILALLSIDQPLHIDKIAEKSLMRINKLLGSILSLEMKGMVEHLPGNHYIKKIRN